LAPGQNPLFFDKLTALFFYLKDKEEKILLFNTLANPIALKLNYLIFLKNNNNKLALNLRLLKEKAIKRK